MEVLMTNAPTVITVQMRFIDLDKQKELIWARAKFIKPSALIVLIRSRHLS